jgi:hypothetical protein
MEKPAVKNVMQCRKPTSTLSIKVSFKKKAAMLAALMLKVGRSSIFYKKHDFQGSF